MYNRSEIYRVDVVYEVWYKNIIGFIAGNVLFSSKDERSKIKTRIQLFVSNSSTNVAGFLVFMRSYNATFCRRKCFF